MKSLFTLIILTFVSFNIYADVNYDIIPEDCSNLSYSSLADINDIFMNAGVNEKVPKLDKKLWKLMRCRSSHPRVDRMILISASIIIQTSKQRIPGVNKIFASLIDNNRLTIWVISFVAGALGDYPYFVWGGNKLQIKLDNRLDQLIKEEQEDPGEYYGNHFMEPPQTKYVQNYILTRDSMAKRKTARIHYYSLRTNYTEESIKSCLEYLEDNGDLETGKPVDFKLRYLSNHIDQVLEKVISSL